MSARPRVSCPRCGLSHYKAVKARRCLAQGKRKKDFITATEYSTARFTIPRRDAAQDKTRLPAGLVSSFILDSAHALGGTA